MITQISDRMRRGFAKRFVKIEAGRLNASIVYVTAMRRSGHHAVINWIIAGVLGEEGCFTYPFGNRWFRLTHDRRVAHVNAVNHLDPRRLRSALKELNNTDASPQVVVISSEDGSAMQPHWLPFRAGLKVVVSRSLLNTISSRVQFMVNQARSGTGLGDCRVDAEFLRRWKEHRTVAEGGGVVLIDYDKWCVEAEYRNEIVRRLDLPYVVPRPAQNIEHAGYTSFTDEPGPDDPGRYLRRYEQLEWSSRLVHVLESDPSVHSLMSREERQFLEDVRSRSEL